MVEPRFIPAPDQSLFSELLLTEIFNWRSRSGRRILEIDIETKEKGDI